MDWQQWLTYALAFGFGLGIGFIEGMSRTARRYQKLLNDYQKLLDDAIASIKRMQDHSARVITVIEQIRPKLKGGQDGSTHLH